MDKQKLICRDFNKNIIGIYDTVQEAADDLIIDAKDIVKAVSQTLFKKLGLNIIYGNEKIINYEQFD